MKDLRTYIYESQDILLLNNETFYEDYVNNRCARNGVKPQIYLTEEQLEWLNDFAGTDDYVLFGENNNPLDIDHVIDLCKTISKQEFENNDTITTFGHDNNVQVFISFHDKRWCIYAPEKFYIDVLKSENFKFDDKK